ncbi:MAG TPA: ABC transporter permease [Sedimentisphaerales bacterium]|nr:ABC transporter permease [Sedimentisphaerales bacterium]
MSQTYFIQNIFITVLANASAFIKKDAKIALSYKFQFIFQFAQIFFSIAMIFFIGKMLESSPNKHLKVYGGDYFSFALIGLAVNSYLHVGLVTITNDIRQMMNQGTLEAVCAAPIKYMSLMIYSSLWQFIFETIRVCAYFVLGFFLFNMKLQNPNIPAAILTMLLTVVVFLLLGTISCSILIVIKRGDPINWIFSGFGALLGGTMFPVSVLPGWLGKLAMFMPLTHSLEAMRKSLLRSASVSEISNNLMALCCFVIILLPLSFYINKISMTAAKKCGAFVTH